MYAIDLLQFFFALSRLWENSHSCFCALPNLPIGSLRTEIGFSIHLLLYTVYQLSNQTIDCMQQSPSWEAKSSSASPETSHILWNPNAHYRTHNRPLFIPVLNQINPVHAFQTDL